MAVPMKKKRSASHITNGKPVSTRYTDEKKAMVLSWYKAKLRSNPYGAMSATQRHFNISATAFNSWLAKDSLAKHTKASPPVALVKFKAKMRVVVKKQMSVMEKILKGLN